MIGRRNSPDGLPFNLYERIGKRLISWGYKNKDNTWAFRISVPKVRKDLVMQGRADAVRKANELNGHFVAENSVGHWFEQYFAWQEGLRRDDERRKTDSTLKGNKQELKSINAYFGKMQPLQVRPMHIYGYLDMRADMGAAAGANKEIALLSAMMEFIRRKGIIENNPCNNIKYNPVRPKTRLVTPAEFDFMMKIARERKGQYLTQALCAQAAYLAVARPDEIRTLRRNHCTPEGIIIFIGKRKPGQPQRQRLIEWSPTLRKVIDEALIIQRQSGMFVFGNKNGQPYNSYSWANNWSRLMDHCEKAATAENVPFERFALSDMRPKAVTQRLEDGDAHITDATGNSARMVQKVYDRRRVKVAKATE